MSSFRARLRRLSGSTVARNAGLMYLVQITNYAFPLLTVPYLARVLSVEKQGLLAFASTIVWYCYTLTEYGFDITATRLVAIHRDDSAAISRIFSTTMVAKALLTVVGFVIMVAAVLCTPKLRPNWPVFVISFMTVMGGLFFPMWLYQGVEKMGVAAARDFAAKLLATMLTFIVVRHDHDYIWVAVFQAGAMAVAGLVSLMAAPRICNVTFRFPVWAEILEAYREGWPVFLSMAALSLIGTTNTMILGFTATLKDVGYFSAATRLLIAVRGLVAPAVTAVYPRISRMVATSQTDAIAFLRRYAFLMAAPFLLASVSLFAGAPLAVRIIYTNKFEPTILLLRIMAFSPFCLALAQVYSTYFMLAFGYSKEWSKIIIWETVLNYVFIGISLLIFNKPTIALAIASCALDVYAVAAPYYFYRKTVAGLLAPSLAITG